MTVTYDGREYKSSFIDRSKIGLMKFRLMFIRQFRRIKNLYDSNDLILFISITMLWILFCFISVLLKKQCNSDPKQAYSLFDAVWDARNAYFSSAVLAEFISLYNRVKKYHAQIKLQHDFYTSVMSDFDDLFEVFLEEEMYDYCPFYCEETINDTRYYLDHFVDMEYILIQNEDLFINSISKIKDTVSSIKERYNNGELILESNSDIMVSISLAENILSELFEAPKKFCESETHYNVCRFLLDILNSIRWLWRKDIDYKKRILNILSKKTENRINDDYYYSMLLYGHRLEIAEDCVFTH